MKKRNWFKENSRMRDKELLYKMSSEVSIRNESIGNLLRLFYVIGEDY
jgi:hypothetical protein